MLHRLLLIVLLSFIPQAMADLLPFGNKPKFLPPDQAFTLQVKTQDDHTLLASFDITPGYYLYQDKVHFTLSNGTAKIASLRLPEAETKNDPNFGKMQVYHNSFQAEIALQGADTKMPLELDASYQGCSDEGLCYPPIEKHFSLDLQTVASAAAPAATPTTDENQQIAELFRSGSFWLIVTFFFGAGLLLSLTPCVFPMIPILSGIIVGRGHQITHAHAFMLSLAYVLGMAITYAIAGVAAGYSGNLISNALQTPWVLGSFAALFVLLALAMFGLYELQLPAALQSRLTDTSNKLHGGHLTGVFAMGALSAIIMGPCVAAPLAGALLYISQTHDAALGGTALFVMGLGMGVPLLLIGTSAGTLLPKAGPWMESVKRFFGVLMLALAIWIVAPVIPVAAQMLAWAALLIFCAIHLRALDPLHPNARGLHKLGKALGILALLLGVAYLIGALSGARDVLRPLGGFQTQAQATEGMATPFERIKGLDGLQAKLVQAKGKVVMLDFYADWCISCKEMERFTFSDPAIRKRLDKAFLLQADVTANDVTDKGLLQRFQLFGPPAILFFDKQGNELVDFRVIGYQDAERFGASLARVGL